MHDRLYLPLLLLSALLACPIVRAAERESFDGPNGTLPAGWRIASGSWKVRDGALVADSLGGEAQITTGDAAWQNYEVEVCATFLQVREPTRWLSVVFRAAPDCSPPWSHFPIRQHTDRPNGIEFAVRTGDKTWSVRMRAKDKAPTAIGQVRTLRVVVNGDHLTTFLDGRKIVDTPFCIDRPRGCVGLAASGCVARFDDFTVRRLPDTPEHTPRAVDATRVLCIAHRGFSAVAPENTLVAVRQAMAAGSDGCEFDVYASKDGVAVLMHDRTVDRTTNGKGDVSQLTVAELQKLDAGSWKGDAFAGEPVPTLLQVLQAMKGKGCKAMIEVKPDGIAKPVVHAIRAADMLDATVVISFRDKALADVRALEPKLPCALVVGGNAKGTPAEWAAHLAGRAAKCGATILDLNYGMLSAELVAELHRRGFAVWCWTVNDPVVMKALARWGVDAITTDRPDLLSH
ncbi:DUF1080 domain-containing protein [bacterium]|nr:DUF1080 domain-containing protein [bacterium]